MTSNPPITVRLQISSIEEPIQGRLIDQRGQDLPFTGWIELSSALSAIASPAEVPGPGENPTDQGDPR